jgi:hypothetical protein
MLDDPGNRMCTDMEDNANPAVWRQRRRSATYDEKGFT